MKDFIKAVRFMIGVVYQNKNLRVGQVLNSVAMTLFVSASFISMFSPNGPTGGWYVAFMILIVVGLILVMIAFNHFASRSGFALSPLVKKEINKNPDDIDYLKRGRESWSTMQAHTLYELINAHGVDASHAVRWSMIMDDRSISSNKEITAKIPSFIERGISPEVFKSLWVSLDTTDVERVANYAEHDIDPQTINAFITTEPTD